MGVDIEVYIDFDGKKKSVEEFIKKLQDKNTPLKADTSNDARAPKLQIRKFKTKSGVLVSYAQSIKHRSFPQRDATLYWTGKTIRFSFLYPWIVFLSNKTTRDFVKAVSQEIAKVFNASVIVYAPDCGAGELFSAAREKKEAVEQTIQRIEEKSTHADIKELEKKEFQKKINEYRKQNTSTEEKVSRKDPNFFAKLKQHLSYTQRIDYNDLGIKDFYTQQVKQNN